MNTTILAIETSCDETAASVYTTKKGVVSSVLFSQIDLHKKYGGVVPELASRSHIEKIQPIVDQALSEAKITLQDTDLIAVTTRPGLPGSLLIGLCFAKALALAHKKPIVGINHLEGHLYSPCIEHNVPFPYLCLTASGGHTSLYIVKSYDSYELLGTTLDDAAGEAFDKVAKLLNLGYPGGPIIEKLAQSVGFQDFFSYPRLKKRNLSFSFSGLKTAVLYDLVNRGAYDLKDKRLLDESTDLACKVASSLLVCIKDIFLDRIALAQKKYPEIKALTFAGGVACNTYLRDEFARYAAKQHLQLFVPSRKYCTDNAAMIAFVASKKDEYDSLHLDIF